MKLRLAFAAATCLALPLVAHAQPVNGPYVSLEAGTSFQMPVKYNTTLGGASGKTLFRESYAGDIAVGYGLGNGWRAQIDMDDLRSTIAENDDSAAGHAGATGLHNTYGPMFNLLYDFNISLPVFFYAGAGIGYQWVHTVSHGAASYSGTYGDPAYDIIAGLSYPVAVVPGLALTAEYRYQKLFTSSSLPETVAGSADEGVVRYRDGSSHNVLLGLRYQLFQPAAPAPAPVPAPEAAPAPVPAKTYLVFFDWDKANLTPRATQVIAQAASDSKTQNVTTLDVSGYTDTSGAPVYNQGLSERRAKAVAAQLVQDGVPASEIEIHAFGATHLLVPTGAGVREPQNRRVEIVLH